MSVLILLNVYERIVQISGGGGATDLSAKEN